MMTHLFYPLLCAMLAFVWMHTAGASASHQILELPDDYQTHRITFRQAISTEGETEIAKMQGEGCLRHFWMTISHILNRPENALALTMRIYFDDEETPHVEVPVGPFFGIHHGKPARKIVSPYLQVTARSGYNAYFPMPYKNGMRVTFQNESDEPISIWFQADYHQYADGSLDEPLRFNAVYRRVNPAQSYGKPYHLAHGTGPGVILGLTLGLRQFDTTDEWYHNGGDQMYLDGNKPDARVLSGIGGEDFFGTAWGQEVFHNNVIGTTYYDRLSPDEEGDPVLEFAAWRFFTPDPVAYSESFYWDFGSLENDMSSVVYWYQEGRAPPVARLPGYADRLPQTQVTAHAYDIPLKRGLRWAVCGPFECKDRRQFQEVEFPEKSSDFAHTEPADFGQYTLAVRLGLGEPAVTRWHQDVPSMFNFVDLAPYFRPKLKTNGGYPTDVSAYARTILTSERNESRTIRVAHDDWFRLWVNGELAYDGDQNNGFRIAEITIDLRQGENEILVKAANKDNANFRAWSFLLDPRPKQ